jgi:hypothetical protein
MHSNDSLLVCGSPTFGRDGNDVVEVVPTTNPRVPASGCSDTTNMKGRWKTDADQLKPPTDDQPLHDIAASDGDLFSGKTIIRLKGATMDVLTSDGVKHPNMQLPDNGVIFVDNVNGGTCDTVSPVKTDYTENDSGCGNVYVSGNYSDNLTIAAANDVIVAPTSNFAINWSSTDEAITQTSGADAVLGLIANRFVRVGHKVNRSANPCANYTSAYNNFNLEVDAAVLALDHSWIVDNYDCGKAGNLTVKGAIAQEYRGPVGTGSHDTGFLKDYNYDDRLRYRSPPYFLSPIAAQWSPVRVNEQVPAR